MGAGPYTQLKFMLLAAEPGNPFFVNEVTLIDPLINYYLTNLDCPYKDNHLEDVAGPVKYMEGQVYGSWWGGVDGHAGRI